MYVRTYHTILVWYVHVYVRTMVRTENVMSQLSDWKRAHMCTENHVCFGRIHGSQLREGANAGQHTPTLSLRPHTTASMARSTAESYTCTMVPWYVRTYVRMYVHVYNFPTRQRCPPQSSQACGPACTIGTCVRTNINIISKTYTCTVVHKVPRCLCF